MTVKGTWMKGGGMDREPHKRESMKDWRHGKAETIKRGGEKSPAKSNGMHGMKLDEKAREKKAENMAEAKGAKMGGKPHKVVHIHKHTHIHHTREK